MKEYIEREAVLKKAVEVSGCFSEMVSAWDIAHEPAADVAEVRRGSWEFLGPNRLAKGYMCGTCSACHVRSIYIVNTAICPNCGARMGKGGLEDETK